MPSLEIELARLIEGAGDAQRALATLTRLAARLPDEPATLVALGKLLHRMGKADEALAPLRTALALRPQDPELKRYVDRLAAGEHGDVGVADELARRFAEDALRAAAAGRAGRRRPDRAAARSCCSTGASCAFTATACRGRSPSGSSRC